jgi:DNA-binding SARP family transcriptional activator
MYTWLKPVMTMLCTKALAWGIEPAYVCALIRERGLSPDPPPIEVEHWPWPIKIFTLGRFEVRREGEPIRFSGKTQKRPLALLKGLIALGGENVSEDRLSDLLWPDADGDAAQDALATTLHRLRQLLTYDAIRRQAGRLSLDRHHCWVDVWALDRMLVRAEDLVAGPNPTEQAWRESAQWTERAVRVYGGDFLADDPESPWSESFAERVRDRLLLQVQKIARHWLQGGNWDLAVACYKRATNIDACSEECCRGLMMAYQHLGRRDEALAVYQRCTRILDARWGVTPSPQTVALLNSLKSGQTTR